MRFGWLIAGLLTSVLGSQTAEGAMTLMGGAGVTAGTLTKASRPLLSKGWEYSLRLSYVPESQRKPWPFVLGLQLKQMKFGFKDGGVSKRATYNLYGFHCGFSMPLAGNFLLQVMGEYYGTAQITVLASHQVLLNGNRYRYSTFESYSGGAASGARLQISHDKTDGQFSARNRYRSGVGFSLVQQSYGKESTKITSSESELTPAPTLTQSEVSYRLLLMSVDIFIGLTF